MRVAPAPSPTPPPADAGAWRVLATIGFAMLAALLMVLGDRSAPGSSDLRCFPFSAATGVAPIGASAVRAGAVRPIVATSAHGGCRQVVLAEGSSDVPAGAR